MKVEKDVDCKDENGKTLNYKILQCPKCFRYAVVGNKKPHCAICGNFENGVYIAQFDRTDYATFTYCTHCGIYWRKIWGDRVRKDEKGYYYEIRSYNASGHEVIKGIGRIYLQKITDAK
jgi:hypothetical protein